MASPLQLSKKIRWPSQKKAGAIGDRVSDFVPYISNVANMFSRVPRPKTPNLIDPVINQKISLDNAKQEVEQQSRAADLSTQGLDAHTGAAIRVGNLATRLRSLSDINSKEAMANAQIGNQANAMNASINAQNTAMMNEYQDQTVNAQMAQNRQASENISNAADKYIGQQAVKDQMKLDKDKMNIMSKAYNPGVYGRLLTSLEKSGVDVTNMGKKEYKNPFDKYKGLTTPLQTAAATSTAPIAQTEQVDNQNYLPTFMRKRQPKYLMQKFAAGGMMEATDPTKPAPPVEDYYQSSATLAHYKDLLNQKLKAKNPEAFSSYFKGLVDLRKTGNSAGASKYVQDTQYNEYLSPDEVRGTLGDDGYNQYLNSLKSVNQYNVQQGRQPLYGNVEGENDLSKLNYGRRFASLQVTPSLSVSNKDRNTRYDRQYTYNPNTKTVDFTETGDISLRPSGLRTKANGGLLAEDPVPKYDIGYMGGNPTAADSAAYRQFYNMMVSKDPRAIEMYNEFTGNTGGWGINPLAGQTLDPRYTGVKQSLMSRSRQAVTRMNALENAQKDLKDNKVQDFYGMKLYKPKDTRRKAFGGKMYKPFC